MNPTFQDTTKLVENINKMTTLQLLQMEYGQLIGEIQNHLEEVWHAGVKGECVHCEDMFYRSHQMYLKLEELIKELEHANMQ